MPRAAELMREHWELVSLDKTVPPDPFWERYEGMEELNRLFILGAFVDGELVGYSANFVDFHVHYRTLLCSHNDVLFLSAAHRSQRLGMRLMEATLDHARGLGVARHHWHAKKDTTLDALLARDVNYRVQDIIYSREL